MKSILLMSLLIATFAVPALTARTPDARRGLRSMCVVFVLVVVAYYFWIAYGHTRYFVPQR